MTINDVPLKNLTFQTGQKKWDGGSIYILVCNGPYIFMVYYINDLLINLYYF